MSTNGCRIECTSNVDDDSWVWLSIAGLETQFCRVVWHCQEFIGLEFEKPLAEAVFNKLLADQSRLPDTAIKELRSIATPHSSACARGRRRRQIAISPICRASARSTQWSRACASAKSAKRR